MKMKRMLICFLMMSFIASGLLAQQGAQPGSPFFGEWVRNAYHEYYGQNMTTTIFINADGWGMNDPGAMDPPERIGYVISGNTIQLNSVWGPHHSTMTGILSGDTLTIGNFVYHRNNRIVPGADLSAKLNWIQANAVSGVTYNVELTRDEHIRNYTFHYPGRNEITIQLSAVGGNRYIGVAGDSGRIFTVGAGVQLVLGSGVTLFGTETGYTDSRVVTINAGGLFTMNEGSRISSSGDGGVHLLGGNFVMNGGEISGNYASIGAGVLVEQGGSFYLQGGEITRNNAYQNGGGAAVITENSFIYLYGGVIHVNNAELEGGGVFISRGSVNMSSNAVIRGNGARRGGGVFIESGTFRKTGGTITGQGSPSSPNVSMGSGDVVGGIRTRNDASGPNDNLNSNTPGREGGWEERAPQTIRRDYITAGNYTFTFNQSYPATIEIFAIGAGGGGQGGHRKVYQQGLGTRNEDGRGAGGGGGGTVYTRLTVNSSVTLNITVGAGGAAGSGHHKGVGGSWESGNPGAAGGDTIVRFGSTTITAPGGRGGAVAGAQNVVGGPGGVIGARPSGLLEWIVSNGTAGVNGRHNSDVGGEGGRPGQINAYSSPVSNINNLTAVLYGIGGRGGHGNNRGTNGANGYVHIVVTF